MSEAFEKAKKCLQPQAVYLRDSILEIKEDYWPRDSGVELSFRMMHGSADNRRHRQLLVRQDDEVVDSTEEYIFRYQMGLIIADGKDVEKAVTPEEIEAVPPLVKILATFELVYWCTEVLPDEGLNEFAIKNTVYHAWPYWREFVQSMSQKIGLPKSIPVPHFHMQKSPIKAGE